MEEERITTKKELRERMKELRETLTWMNRCIDENKLEDLDSSYFEDLMCLSAELYYKMGGN